MAVLTILQYPPSAPPPAVLRQKAAKVSKVDKTVLSLLDDLAETLAAAGGLGLAAVQVGVPQRLFVVRNGADYLKLVNPEIVRSEGRQDSPEACLSLPGVFARVRRPALVAVRALDVKGKPFDFEGTGRLACVLAHEADHLDGILFTDKAYAVRRFSTPVRSPAPGPRGPA